MSLEKYKNKAETLLNKVQELIDELPHKGDKCSDSQKMCLQINLQELEHTFNGLEEADFNEEKD